MLLKATTGAAAAAAALAVLLLTGATLRGQAGRHAGGDSGGSDLPCVEEVPGPVSLKRA
jgi:hypothetical protein